MSTHDLPNHARPNVQRQTPDHREQFRRLLEASGNLFVIIGADYRYILVNSAYASLYGLRVDQIEGQAVQDILDQRVFEREFCPAMERALANESIDFEAERHFHTVGYRRLRIRYHPLPEADGTIRQVGVTVSDITELHAAEVDLDKQDRLLEIAGRTARFGGWSVDLATMETRISQMVAEIHGYPPEQPPTVEQGIDFYAPEHRARIRDCVTACAERGLAFDEELQIVRIDGERRWVRVVGEPVYATDGRIQRIQGSFQDITERRLVQKRLQQYRQLVEHTSDLCSLIDANFRYRLVNRAYTEHFGLNRSAIEGQTVAAIVGPAFFDQTVRPRLTLALAGTPQQFEAEQDHPRIGRRQILVRYFPIEPASDGAALVAAVVTDISDLHEARARLLSSHRELEQALATRQALINSLPAHIALLDHTGTVLDINDQWRHYGREGGNTDPGFGVGRNYPAICAEAVGDDASEAREVAAELSALLAGERATLVREYPCHAPHKQQWFRLMASRLDGDSTHPAAPGAVVMHVDITERKLAEQELNRVAFEDMTTGVLTRQGFIAQMQQHLVESGWQPDDIVAILDLVGQRNVNDAHGFEVGDRLLAAVGERLRAFAGENIPVGRLGGDEFVVLLRATEYAAHLSPAERCHTLRELVSEAFLIDDHRIQVSAHFGYTLCGDHTREPQQLLHEAEIALFEAREQGGLEIHAYTADIAHAARQRIALTAELRSALERGEFELYFQPKVELTSGELTGAEALLRWHHPERGLVPPGVFIPIAEQSQLIAPIGDWAVDEACRLLREWQGAGLGIVRVAVNVSVVQFRLGRFTETVRQALARHGIAPGSLTLEITESVFERESELLQRQMRELHSLGVRLSLDDFGTGYSSLLYLQQYPFDEIKIDRGFVQHMDSDAYSRNIVAIVLGICHALRADTVAEGIETPAVRDALVEMGCRLGQGYYYSVPLGAEDLRWLLEQQAQLPLHTAGQGASPR